jgi:hypothetical protein
MPLNSLSVGRDTTIVLNDPNSGGVPAVAHVTSFDTKQDHTKLKSKGLDGVVRHAVEPDGWSGKIALDRANPNLDKLFAILETAYYAGTNVLPQTITQTIQEDDGTVTQWQYTGCAIGYDEAGAWQNGKFISQSVSWCASKRTLLV